jgi:hypothetical protein
MPALPIGRQVQSRQMKMDAYTSNKPNEKDGMPSLKISNFEIFKYMQIKLDRLICLPCLKRQILINGVSVKIKRNDSQIGIFQLAPNLTLVNSTCI